MSPNRSNYHAGQKADACHFCRARGTVEHHIIPQRFGGPDTKNNIVELCTQCHQKLERLYDSSFYEWLGIEDEAGERRYHRPCFRDGCNQTAAATIRWKTNESDIVCEEHAETLVARTSAEVVEMADD